METVSTKLYIKLDKQIACEHICGMIQHIMNNYNQTYGNVENSVLVMEIKRPLESDGDNPIPKLEFKTEEIAP